MLNWCVMCLLHTIMCLFYADKKGGNLASVVYSYMQHGDPVLHSTVRHLLSLVG